jgi:alkanesulfonate monooxygenase SsuD/methylene tetrahydromethanopterin reductase-like flavin-dependent oxidoreductase (luciferase family)
VQFHLFLPQMRLSAQQLVDRARSAEAAGFSGIALMDHLAPPGAEAHPMYDAMASVTWLAAHTTTLTVGHLVLCDGFRHPAVLARQAVTLDHLSGGRFELGIGWGSVPDEFDRFGVGPAEGRTPAQRVARLGETLDVMDALWSGEEVTYRGEFHQLDRAVQNPKPLGAIPIVIGGAGPKTMSLVAGHAHWWNVPVHRLDMLEERRDLAGDARVSVQEMVAFVPSEKDRAEVTETAMRRFGYMGDGLVVGTANELIDHFGALARAGVERHYVWFADFAAPATLEAFGAQVVAALAD